MTSPHKRLKGRKPQVTFSSTTTIIPPSKMSYYSQQQHQYQSPQTYSYGQMPTYQPQSTCTYGVYSPRVRSQLSPTLGSGYDYYNAHSGSGNRYMRLTALLYGLLMLSFSRSEYDSLWSRLRRTFGTKGYDRREAKRCFKMVYGNSTDIHQFSKTHYRDLGAAVGYQAIRVWEHQHNTYRIPLNPDREREREQLAGLAIAEGLWICGEGPQFRLVSKLVVRSFQALGSLESSRTPKLSS